MQNFRLIFIFLSGVFLFHTSSSGHNIGISSLYFEPNHNRFVSDVFYFSIGNTVSVACYQNALVFFTYNSQEYYRVVFPKGKPKEITGNIPLPSYSTYFYGTNSTPAIAVHYKAVIYKEIFPGIDLYLYEKGGNFKFDFIVHPDSKPDAISINFETLDIHKQKWISKNPEIDENIIRIVHDNVKLDFYAPCAFQWINGISHKIPIRLSYDNGVKFYIPESSYNPNYPLLIDPTLLAGTYLGGNNTDKIIDVKTDTAGSIYLVGETKSLNFPTSAGSLQTNYSGGDITGDIFIAKLNPLANYPLFSTFLGGSGDDSATAIRIDEQRNIYITGITSSSDFPTTTNAYQTTKAGGRDAFITKINSDATELIYSSYIGGSGDESIMDFTFLPDNNIVLTGWTQSSDFPITGSSSLNSMFSGGGLDGFLFKCNSSFQPIWSGFIGTAGIDVCKTIVNFGGDIILSGYTSSMNFPTTQGVFQISYGGGNYDSFIMKLSGNNASTISSSYFGGSLIDLCQALICDSYGNIYITGETSSTNFPVSITSFQIGYGGGERDAFVSKLSPNLDQIIFSTYLGGSKTESGLGIELDTLSRVYVVGYTYSGDFPVIPGTLQPLYGGNQDAFFACLNPNGNTLQYSTFYGGKGEEKARSVYISNSNVMYTVGETASNLLPITSGTFQTSFGGGTLDGFLACIDVSPPTNEGEGQIEGNIEGTPEGSLEGEGLRVWTIAPVERVVTEGATTTFIIGVSGYVGTVNYQWQFKSIIGEEYIPIFNSNSPMLTLRNIQFSSSGYYRCRVSDSLGTVFSSPFKLTVLQSLEGSTEGLLEGNIEGIIEGSAEGTTEGLLEGVEEGILEGISEGSNEGILLEGEGIIEEGLMEGEGAYYPCGFEINGNETHSLLKDKAQNLYYIYVPNEGTLNDLIVNISLTHDNLQQILIQIVSPYGTEVFLLIYPAQGGTSLQNTNFDDNAEISISDGVSPFTGSYKPVGYLGVLRGENLQGTWMLRIVDSETGSRGYLESWKLLFNTYACSEEGNPEEGEIVMYHSADTDKNHSFSLVEVLRVIQIFNFGSYHCDINGEDGYGLGIGDQNCNRHSSDYTGPYWSITFPELLRLIQLFNIGGYLSCSDTEDGFCPIQ
ncbi:MAG: SBBP repeat-containing protein [Candidatus Hydrogenedens sp.]